MLLSFKKQLDFVLEIMQNPQKNNTNNHVENKNIRRKYHHWNVQ